MTTDKRRWSVEMRCVVIKEVIVTDCTEQQARDETWKFSNGEEIEIDMPDWEVLSVKEQL